MSTSTSTAAGSDFGPRFRRILGNEPDFAGHSEAARRILTAAAEQFYERGYAATSIRELTRACGLSPGALYNHFESRDQLLYVLVAAGHAQVERALDAAADAADGTATDRLRCFVRAYIERHLYLPAYAQLVHREYVHLSSERREHIVERRRAIRARLVDILRAGASDGSFELIPGPSAAVRQAMMIMDMCSRTSEWFTPSAARSELTGDYVTAALRLVGA